MKIYIIWSKNWCKAREKKYGMGKKSSQQLADNGKPSLMAHKLSCLTTHFAQLPIHHANTNAPMQRMLSTTTITTAMPKVKRSKKATDTKKRKEWMTSDEMTYKYTQLFDVLEPKNYTKLFVFISTTEHNAPKSIAQTPNRTYTWIGFVPLSLLFGKSQKNLCIFSFVFSWDYFSLLYFMQWMTQWKYRWKKGPKRYCIICACVCVNHTLFTVI